MKLRRRVTALTWPDATKAATAARPNRRYAAVLDDHTVWKPRLATQLIQEVSMHEAAHAIVAHALGVPVHGLHLHAKPGRCPTGLTWYGSVKSLENDAAIALAGRLAELLMRPSRRVDGGEEDVQEVLRRLRRKLKPKDVEPCLSRGFGKAYAILTGQWADVVRLAEDLMDAGSLHRNRRHGRLEGESVIGPPRTILGPVLKGRGALAAKRRYNHSPKGKAAARQ